MYSLVEEEDFGDLLLAVQEGRNQVAVEEHSLAEMVELEVAAAAKDRSNWAAETEVVYCFGFRHDESTQKVSSFHLERNLDAVLLE